MAFQAQKVMVGYSNEYKVDMQLLDMQLRSKIEFDGCLLNQQNLL